MSELLSSPAVAVRVIRDEQAWDAIQPQWELLFERSPYAATPLRFAWLRNWWKCYGATYGAQQNGLRIVTVWRNEQLVGALPLYESILHLSIFNLRRIGFISTGEALHEETCPDYMNLLCLPGEEANCLRSMQETLHRMDWDFMELVNVRERSPLLDVQSWSDGPCQVTNGEGCPLSDLSGGFDAYLGRLNSKHRKNAKRCLRRASEAGAVLELADASNVGVFFDDLVQLHQKRWNSLGMPGCFSADRFTAFHRAMVRDEVPRGDAVLARLRVGQRIVAAVYGFITGSKFDVYQSGVEVAEDGPVQSPGVAAHLLLMAKLCERGVTAYDFLRGTCQYKNGLSTGMSGLYTLRAWRPTVRALAHRSCRMLGFRPRPDSPVRPQVA
jgi:CelD/BcsL family acetyltransferase involved in cellulose biosynthesis